MILDDQDTQTSAVLKKQALYVVAGIGIFIAILYFAGRHMAMKEVK
jgi:hypothetical protein